jgi:PAS domain S-box-containing protein
VPERFEHPELFVTLIEAAPDAVVAVDDDGTLIYANERAQELFGYSAKELLGQSIEMLVPDTIRAAHVSMREGYMAVRRTRPMGTGRDLKGRRSDGSTFPVDVSLSPVTTPQGRIITAFVRDATETRRRQRQAEAVGEIAAALLEDQAVPDVLALAARHTRAVTSADAAWVVTPEDDALVVRAAAGYGAAEFLGVRASVHDSVAGIAVLEREALVIPSLTDHNLAPDRAKAQGYGPAIVIPLVAGERDFGALVAARLIGQPAFSEEDVQGAKFFARSAAVTLAFGEARAELDRQHVMAEQERIGRELLNRVIHDIYGIGLMLQSSISRANSEVAPRLDEAVSKLDEVIHNIRAVVFGLVDEVDVVGE